MSGFEGEKLNLRGFPLSFDRDVVNELLEGNVIDDGEAPDDVPEEVVPESASPSWSGVTAAGQALPPALPPPDLQGVAPPSELLGDPTGVSFPALPPFFGCAAGAATLSYLNLPGAYSPIRASSFLKVADSCWASVGFARCTP